MHVWTCYLYAPHTTCRFADRYCNRTPPWVRANGYMPGTVLCLKPRDSYWSECYNDIWGVTHHAGIKGEVRAICRFWVFDGNGLLGHRLIDSRWFEKNPPTESGWKRRSKKTPTYRYFARKWSWRNMCFQVRAISSRLWFTYIFAFDSGSLSIAGGWRKYGTLLIFCQTVVLVSPLLLQE